MTLAPASVAYVQRTWAAIETVAPRPAATFDRRLFEAAPHLRPTFQGDMETQGRKRMETIAGARLGRPAALGHVLAVLGRRHADYGVHPGLSVVVGGALLETLADGLGDPFTSEVESAWAEETPSPTP